ncbi:hypothetical protein JCM1841_004636 [Sporobolomyces salmonicolor]
MAELAQLTRLDVVLRETLTFRYPSPANRNYVVRALPRVPSLLTTNVSVSPDMGNPTAFAVLYQNVPVAFKLTDMVPSSYMPVTVRAAKHIDAAYHLKVRAMVEGAHEVAVDAWPVVIGNVSSRAAKGIRADIGYVEGLCERAGLAPTSAGSSQPGQTPSISLPLVPGNLSRSPMLPSPSPALPLCAPRAAGETDDVARRAGARGRRAGARKRRVREVPTRDGFFRV